MSQRSLRPQLNQIRAWVRQGRTDAWIAHQLEVGASELREFRSQHGLSPDDEDGGQEIDLRDEIEAEIEAATVETDEDEPDEDEPDEDEQTDPDQAEETEPDGSEAEGRPRRRRRGRRGGRGRRKAELEATFDHGEKDGFGLWLDPAIRDDATYAEHWAGHREVTVKLEPDQIVVRRSGEPTPDDEDSG